MNTTQNYLDLSEEEQLYNRVSRCIKYYPNELDRHLVLWNEVINL